MIAGWVVQRVDWCTRVTLYKGMGCGYWTAARSRAFLFKEQADAEDEAATWRADNPWRTGEYAAEAHHVVDMNAWLKTGATW